MEGSAIEGLSLSLPSFICPAPSLSLSCIPFRTLRRPGFAFVESEFLSLAELAFVRHIPSSLSILPAYFFPVNCCLYLFLFFSREARFLTRGHISFLKSMLSWQPLHRRRIAPPSTAAVSYKTKTRVSSERCAGSEVESPSSDAGCEGWFLPGVVCSFFLPLLWGSAVADVMHKRYFIAKSLRLRNIINVV